MTQKNVSYRDYVRQFGIKEGAKKWKEQKEKNITINEGEKEKVYESKPIEVSTEPQIDNLEIIQRAILNERLNDVRKSERDILECGTATSELIQMPIWYKWLMPQIKNDAVNFIRKALVTSGEDSHKATGGYNYAMKLLKLMDKWIQDYVYIRRREEAKKHAL